MKLKSIIIFAILILSLVTARADAQSLTWLGTLGGESSKAYAISDDGAIVVGHIIISSGESRAVKWSQSTGLQILNGLQNINSWARAISSDGSVIVGTAEENVRKAFRYIQNGPFEYLAPLGGSDFNTSEARDLSSDGSKIVGEMRNLSDEIRGFVWSETLGMTELSTLQYQGVSSEVSAISGDGDLLVGSGSFSDSVLNYSALPVEWENIPFYHIGTLPYFLLIEYGLVEEISENGAYAVGEFKINGKRRGERWHREPPGIWSTYTDLGFLDGIPDSVGICYALDVSNDGLVVGRTTDLTGFDWAAYIWEKTSPTTDAMFNLNELYSNVINRSGYLISANAISPDGRFIVGYGYRLSTRKEEAFLLDRGVATLVGDLNAVPEHFYLAQNYPNPFNPSTKIRYSIPNVTLNSSSRAESREGGFVTLKVYDVLGNEVATLVNEEKPTGVYEVEFSVGQHSGADITSGVYFYQLRAGSFVETKKMTLIK